MAAEEKMRQGMSREDALRVVRLERGSLEVTKEVVRAASWEFVVETLWQDLRFALRQVRRNPGFALAAILTSICERIIVATSAPVLYKHDFAHSSWPAAAVCDTGPLA
jgi:hypothetical protein